MTNLSKNFPKLTKVLKKASYFDDYKRNKILKEMAKFFDNINKLFLDACQSMRLDDAKLIYELASSAGITIDINDDYIDQFELLCSDYTLEYAKLMYEISYEMNRSIDITENDNYLFRLACQFDEIETARWLASINKNNYHLIIEDGKIKEFGIK